jgi:hypothetical protein
MVTVTGCEQLHNTHACQSTDVIAAGVSAQICTCPRFIHCRDAQVPALAHKQAACALECKLAAVAPWHGLQWQPTCRQLYATSQPDGWCLNINTACMQQAGPETLSARMCACCNKRLQHMLMLPSTSYIHGTRWGHYCTAC